MDSDKLEIGNLSRHTLGLKEIGKQKSKEVVFRLNQANPHAKAKYIDKDFKFCAESIKKMDNYDLIIDCTGEDSVLSDLEQFEFKSKKILYQYL